MWAKTIAFALIGLMVISAEAPRSARVVLNFLAPYTALASTNIVLARTLATDTSFVTERNIATDSWLAAVGRTRECNGGIRLFYAYKKKSCQSFQSLEILPATAEP
jgi:hypothetical protein